MKTPRFECNVSLFTPISESSLVARRHHNPKQKEDSHTPLWMRLSTFAMSSRPSSENAACHLLALRVFPAYEHKIQSKHKKLS